MRESLTDGGRRGRTLRVLAIGLAILLVVAFVAARWHHRRAATRHTMAIDVPVFPDGQWRPDGETVVLPVDLAHLGGTGSKAILVGYTSAEAYPPWQAFLIQDGQEPEVVQSGEGLVGGVAVSPDGSQVLLHWTAENGSKPRSLTRRMTVRWVRLSGDRPGLIGEFAGESIGSTRSFASCWNQQGSSWASHRYYQGYVLHREGEEEVLPFVRQSLPPEETPRPPSWTRQMWPGAGESEVYVLLDSGLVYRVSPSGAERVLSVSTGENAKPEAVVATGDVVFAVLKDELRRADLRTGKVETRSLARLTDEFGSVSRVFALDEHAVVLCWERPVDDDWNAWTVYVVRYADLKCQKLLSAMAAESSIGLYVAGDAERVWIAWDASTWTSTCELDAKTMLTSRSLPRWVREDP